MGKYIENFIFISTFCLMLTFVSLGYAQDNEQGSSGGWEVGVHTGPLLPNQISGITEIQPTWGFHLGHGNGREGTELGVAHSRARGVTYYNVSLSSRTVMPLGDLLGIFKAGVDGHYYKSLGLEDFQFTGGVHFGGGIGIKINSSTLVHTEMKFNLNPGTALYFGFGFTRLLGGAKK